MFYNIEFFFEKPYRLFTSEEETEYTVTQEQFELYNSGNYIKGDDGNPKKIEEPIKERTFRDELIETNPNEIKGEPPVPTVSNEQIMSALSELSETMAKLIGDKND